MIRRLLAAIALLVAGPALAQTPPNAPVIDGNALNGGNAAIAVTSTITGKIVRVPGSVMLCVSGTDLIICPASGGGGGSGGDASAANQTSQIGLETAIRDRIGASSSPAAGTVNYWLSLVGGTVATIGGAAPGTGQQIVGQDPAGVPRAFGTDAGGRLLPGQGVASGSDGSAAPVPVTLAASTATQLSVAVTKRTGFTVQVEQALTAPIYLCTRVTTGCSATSHDGYIPGSAGDGTVWTFLFATNSAIWYYTTGTPKVLPVNWQ